jgi:hypothetical protein
VSPPRVFVSSPTVLTRAQDATQRRVLREVERSGLAALYLDRTGYSVAPWRQLTQTIGKADGALVLGFRQMHVETGAWRPGTVEEGPAAGWYSTSWNQLEAGLVVMAGLPVLVLPEEGVRDGVFVPNLWDDNVYGVTMGTSGPPTLSQDMFRDWVHAVHLHASTNHRQTPARSGGSRRRSPAFHHAPRR